jgi:hypothetical protein
MARISVLRPEINIILCETRGFVYIRYEVRVNGYISEQFAARTSILKVKI